MGRGTPPGSAGVPPACTAVASRSGSLRCSTRRPRRPERHGLGRSGAVAGPARNLMGAKPAIRGRFLVERSKPSIAGFVSIVPGRMRARRPRSRVGCIPWTSSQQGRSIGLCIHSQFVLVAGLPKTKSCKSRASMQITPVKHKVSGRPTATQPFTTGRALH